MILISFTIFTCEHSHKEMAYLSQVISFDASRRQAVTISAPSRPIPQLSNLISVSSKGFKSDPKGELTLT